MDEENLETLRKISKKGSLLEKTGLLGMAKELIEIEESIGSLDSKVDAKFSDLNDSLKKKLELELSYEVDEDKIVESVLAKVEIPAPKKGDKGDSYTLTASDKKEIAASIKVPVVEKVIEKTEVIREQPIVNETIKQIENQETGEDIVLKINGLSLEDEDLKIDASHLKGLEKFLDVVRGKVVLGGTKFLSYLWGDVAIDNPQNDDVLKYDSTLGKWKNGTSSGSSQTLAQTLVQGNTTNGKDIVVSAGDKITSPSTLQQESASGQYKYGNGATEIGKMDFSALTANQAYDFPDNSGTLALISDIPSVPVTSVFSRTGNVTAQSGDYDTSQVTENTNLYFTGARAIASLLTGFSAAPGTVSSSDSILTAIQKIVGNAGAPSGAGANLSASQSLPDGVDMTFIPDRVFYDLRSEYDNTTGIFTCTDAGRYQVSAGLAVNNALGASMTFTMTAYLVHSGTPTPMLKSAVNDISGLAISVTATAVNLTGTIQAQAGDQIYVVVNQINGSFDLGSLMDEWSWLTINKT